jgi:hypothetical protein
MNFHERVPFALHLRQGSRLHVIIELQSVSPSIHLQWIEHANVVDDQRTTRRLCTKEGSRLCGGYREHPLMQFCKLPGSYA